ncbi:hypothetical protein F2Q68_00025596 [Brassica cretica]|uniref:Uncharacterized protein n=1 Tax=Brassica cretica TaxID=69181 RepID=A0A8S9IKE3_BRACR|nr:hypothetical protein F2Q68_00025596 [Brassica cretica]
MDPNQTSGTTPSGINDIDLIGSNSPAGVTPVGLTRTTDATGTTPTQHIPPIGTSSQDRSLPINQTTIPEQTGSQVWNRPGKKPPSDDPTRSQSIPISPTHLAQTRGELTELRGMMTTLIDEIRSQRITNQALLIGWIKPKRTSQNIELQALEKETEHPRSTKVNIQRTKYRIVRHPRDPKRPIQTLHGRKFGTTPTAGHCPPKFKLQRIGRSRN